MGDAYVLGVTLICGGCGTGVSPQGSRVREWLGADGPFDAVANTMGSPPQGAAAAPLTNKNTNFSAIYIEEVSFCMTAKRLDNLTPHQRHAYVIRSRWGWRLQRIAQELGNTLGSASALVKRAQMRAGRPSKGEARTIFGKNGAPCCAELSRCPGTVMPIGRQKSRVSEDAPGLAATRSGARLRCRSRRRAPLHGVPLRVAANPRPVY
jgi:hypothetical protein